MRQKTLPKKSQPEKPSRQQQMMQRLTRYLKLHYAFRYNLLTERTECARINTDLTNDPHHLIYTPVDSRTLNGIALDAIDSGVDCWDRDVKRYVESDHVQAYHPFDLYFKQLPAWDGTDRVTELAKRVSWPNGCPTPNSGHVLSTAGCWPSPPSGQVVAERDAAPTVWHRYWSALHRG